VFGSQAGQEGPQKADEDQQEEGDKIRDSMVSKAIHLHVPSQVCFHSGSQMCVFIAADCYGLVPSRDTKPLLVICKELFFFIYCPLLPLWWILDFMWEYSRRKWRRHKRKKRFREKRAARRAQKEKTYLMLDQFTRGKVERQIIDFDKEVKAKKNKKPKKGFVCVWVGGGGGGWGRWGLVSGGGGEEQGGSCVH